MKLKSKFLLAGIIFIFALLCVYFLFASTDKSMDILEALRFSSAEAKKWSGNAEPYFITSVDEDTSTWHTGENGERRYWNLFYGIPGTDRMLIITIHDKKIVHFVPVENPAGDASYIEIDKLKLSSKDALKKATALYGLLPGRTWARGYHFTMESYDGYPVLTVVGLNTEKKMTRMFFNAITGEIIH